MIRLAVPSIEEADLEAVREVLTSGHLVQGPRVGAFERAVQVDRRGVDRPGQVGLLAQLQQVLDADHQQARGRGREERGHCRKVECCNPAQ